jgi:hypothetical protein
MAKEIRILSTQAFGQGINSEFWQAGLDLKPDVIAAQGTSSDGGPAYLSSQSPFNAIGIRNDLRKIITSAKRLKIPFILSSGGPGGSNRTLSIAIGLVNEIAKEESLQLKVAVIPGELDKNYLKKKLRDGFKARRLAGTERLSEYLTEREVDEAECIVSQMGPEPIIQALKQGVDGVITGRALDVALYMAFPLLNGFDPGLTAHLAKTIECSGLVTTPQSGDPVFGILRDDYFLVRPTNKNTKCTIQSVIGHAFYERSDPYGEENPGFRLDISNAKYEQYDDATVKVSGSRKIPRPYTLKVEGVKVAGYRTICVSGIRDPHLMESLDWFLKDTVGYVQKKHAEYEWRKDYELYFRVYGKDAVLGRVEPIKKTASHEFGLIIESLARTQPVANAICTAAVDYIAHMPYPGRISTAANVAFSYSPREMPLGASYTYHIWHALELDDPCEPFKIQMVSFPSN